VTGQQHTLAALNPKERTGTHFTGGWVGPRAGLDGQKISSQQGFDHGSSSLQSVAIPTELPGPQCRRQSTNMKIAKKCKRGTKLGKFNSRKIKGSSEKINKYSMDMGRWNRDMT